MSPPFAPYCRGRRSSRREEGQRTPPPAGNAAPGQAGKAPDNRLVVGLHVYYVSPFLVVLSVLAIFITLQVMKVLQVL